MLLSMNFFAVPARFIAYSSIHIIDKYLIETNAVGCVPVTATLERFEE